MKSIINQDSVVPLYYQIKSILKEKIKLEEWKGGHKIPNELELAKSFDVSRSTIRQAILELVSEELLYRKKGVGTFVSNRKYELNFTTFTYPEELGSKHKFISSKIVKIPEEYREMFKMKEDERVYELKRIRYFKDDPAVLEISYLPVKLFPDLLNKNLEKKIYSIIKDQYKMYIDHKKSYIEPILLTEEHSKLLFAEKNRPALKITKFCEDSKEQLILLGINILKEDRCKLLLSSE